MDTPDHLIQRGVGGHGRVVSDMPDRRFGVHITHTGHYGKPPVVAPAERFAAAVSVKPGRPGSAIMGYDFACQ